MAEQDPVATSHVITCKACGTSTVMLPEHAGRNIHDHLVCRCCGDDHVHAHPDTGETVNPCRNVLVLVSAAVTPVVDWDAVPGMGAGNGQ